jgi:hypothetical protein
MNQDYKNGYTSFPRKLYDTTSELYKSYIKSYPQYEFMTLEKTSEYEDFCKGWVDARKETFEKFSKEYKLSEFLQELKTLCKKYNVSINSEGFGGGHNDRITGNASINDLYFSIDIQSNIPTSEE